MPEPTNNRMPISHVPKGLHRFAVATASCTVLLLMAGALVTSNDAADSVPDWPLAYGKIIPPLVGGIRYEYAHRLMAGTVAILTAILAIWLARKGSPFLRKLGWTALGLVIAQAILGGMRVLFHDPALTATIHAILAQIFFITVVSLALFTSPWWNSKLAELDDPGSPSVRNLSLITTAAIFVQLILGAGFRHGAFGILPHMIGAVVVLFLVIWTGRTVRKRFGSVRDLRRWGILLQAFLGTQILLGIAAYWAVVQEITSAQPTQTYVFLTVAHVLVGALTLAASVLLTLASIRMIGGGAADATDTQRIANSSAESSRA
ncbi:MAG: COX15/CtaA family protein [Candidatus Acidiferrales bacterium]